MHAVMDPRGQSGLWSEFHPKCLWRPVEWRHILVFIEAERETNIYSSGSQRFQCHGHF